MESIPSNTNQNVSNPTEQKVSSQSQPNQTIYVNNLNEKIKLDGNYLINIRIKTEFISAIFSIWGYSRSPCEEIIQNEGSSICSIQRLKFCDNSQAFS